VPFNNIMSYFIIMFLQSIISLNSVQLIMGLFGSFYLFFWQPKGEELGLPNAYYRALNLYISIDGVYIAPTLLAICVMCFQDTDSA
ncbi:hypothetical protein ACJX0J_034974, partial [Zea mays]